MSTEEAIGALRKDSIADEWRIVVDDVVNLRRELFLCSVLFYAVSLR